MNLVELLEKAVNDKDWNLVTKALFLVNGKEQVKEVVVDKKPEKKIGGFENKFVDDLSLETHLIDKNLKPREKTYRKPSSEKDFYTSTQCSSCGTQVKIPVEEYKFRKMDSEASSFTCIKCIRKMR